ncbi:MAG: hypothetical protein ACRDC4_00795 [Plesiomonas sp.]
MIEVYYLTRDCGDGSSTVDFFRNKELAERLIDEHEDFMMNEYVPSFQVPDTGTIEFQDEYYD